MKRFVLLLMVLGLVAGSVTTAEAAKNSNGRRAPVERNVEEKYGPYPAPVTGCNEPLSSWACAAIETRANEAFFTAKVADTHGQPVFVEVYGGGGFVGAFCGETKEAISFPAGSTLSFHVALNNWSVSTHCPMHRIKTTGTISVTLSTQDAPRPVRAGSIITGAGWFLDGQIGGCQMSPECAVWLGEGCRGLISGRASGLTASIVDVDELADGPPIERVFRFRSGEPELGWGGAQLQFWTSDCVEILDARWRSTDCDRDAGGRDCSVRRFRIPPTARWMTVTAYQDNVNLEWTLT